MVKVNAYCNQVGNYQKFNLESELIKFKRFHDRIERMPESQEKYWAFKDYLAYFYFLADLFPEEEFPFEVFDFDLDKIGRRLVKDNVYVGNELLRNIELVNGIFSDVRKINDEYGLFKKYDLRKKINPKVGVELLEEFAKEMSKRFNDVFRKVINGNIYNLLEEDNCYAFDLSYCDEYKVANSAKLNDYEAYYSIIHELGHCYNFDLIKGRNFHVNFDEEVASIFMEIIFNMFADKYLYGNEYGINTIFNRQSSMANIVAIENIILSNSSDFSLGDMGIKCKLNIQKLTDRDKEMLREYDIKEDNLKQEFIDQEEYISWFKYPLSNLIAIYLADIYMQDKKEGIKLLDNYLMLPPSVDLEDRLTMYDITGESYKKLIRKVSDYGKRRGLI